jgi:outer membrane protein OmpA-like peptidoglycan-associated protein
MFKQMYFGFLIILPMGLITACSNTPYTPVASQADPVDVNAYAPKVDSFVVILDSSSSMGEDDQDRPKIQTAQDLVATFNSAVPALDFNAGLVTFGKRCDKHFSSGGASDVYGMTSFQSADFAESLASLECTGGTTPMSEGIEATTQLLSSTTSPTAVILVSDFQWIDASAVTAAVDELKTQHGNNVCLHTIKMGNNTTGDALISNITDVAGCDTAVGAGDISSAAAMSAYVTETLMAPLQYEKHTVSATALFDFNKAVLKEQGKAELHNLDERIKSQGMSVGDIDVIGHTDSIGDEAYNQELSVRRAQAVKDFMVSEGIDAGIVDVIGKGESEPAASNDTEEGQAQNRRVEIHVGTSRPIK